MPRRASRGERTQPRPHRHRPDAVARQPPAREQPVGGHPAGRRRPLHEGHRQVAAHGVAGEHDARVRRAHTGARPPRLEPHEHAVALDQPLLVHDVETGRLGVEPVAARRRIRRAGRTRRCPRAARRRAARRPSRRARRATGPLPLELVEHRHVVERPVAARAEERRPLRLHRADQPEAPDGEGRGGPDAGHGLPPRRAGLVVAPSPGTTATSLRSAPGRSRARRHPPGASPGRRAGRRRAAPRCRPARSATERTSRPSRTSTPRVQVRAERPHSARS